MPYLRHGRDLKGWDCFGLIRYVLLKEAGIEIPLFDVASDVSEFRWYLGRKISPWIKVPKPDQQFDLVSMDSVTAKGRRELHIGIMLNSKLLHSEKGHGTMYVPLNHPTINYRLRNFYRHDSRYISS